MKSKALILSLVFASCLFLSGDAFARRIGPTGPEQQNIAKAVAYACEGLILGFSRNPSLEEQLFGIYDDHIRELMTLNTPDSIVDLAEAKGVIARGLIVAIARNPSLIQRLNEIADMCEENIRSL